MTESSEAFFINKSSSMSFNELGEYIAMCFEHLENPQKHLANAKKIPVLKKTYNQLLEKLESKLLRIERLVFCRKQLEAVKPPEIGKTLDINFTNLEQYYKKVQLDKNSILSEVNQTKHAVEEILTILLQSLFSEVSTASIFVNSSEPYYKVIELIYELSNSNKEVEQIIRSYRFRDFEKLFANNFQSNKNDKYMKDFFCSNDLPDALSIFRNKFGDSLLKYEKNFNIFSLDEPERNHIIKRKWREKTFHNKLKNLEKSWIKFKANYLKNLDYVDQFNKINYKDKDTKKRNFEELKEDNEKILSLEDEIIKDICIEKDLQARLERIIELEGEWKALKNKKNTAAVHVINKIYNEYRLERKKYIDNFVGTFNSLITDTISQIDNEIKKLVRGNNLDSYLQLTKESFADLHSIKERIFGDSKQMIVKEIFWDLLPQGEWKTEGLIKTFKDYGWSKDEFDESRLTQIIKILKPTICYIGKEKFQGYVVFGFDSSEKVVLECPKYGNAIYIIEDNWQEITKLSKWEARQLSQVTVIRHSDTWFERLKENLESKY